MGVGWVAGLLLFRRGSGGVRTERVEAIDCTCVDCVVVWGDVVGFVFMAVL